MKKETNICRLIHIKGCVLSNTLCSEDHTW